jgi:orotate phosphoribosyltransferase
MNWHEEIVDLLDAREGHFLLESGHHGDLWLELDSLFLRPGRLAPLAAELARRLAAHEVDAVCGPMRSGARGSLRDLEACGARTVALRALLTLGAGASGLAEDAGLALERLASLPSSLWEPSECPMCAAGITLERKR